MTTRFADHLIDGTLAARPAATTVPVGTLYSADDGVIYQSDGTAWAAWATINGAATLDDLTDVDTTTTAPADGDTLVYDAASDLWVPGAPTGSAAGDSTWTAVTFQNGWTNYDAANYSAAGYRKDGNGFVHLRGLVKNGTFQAAIFTLPTGYRPAGNKGYPVMSNGGLGQLNINPAGAASLNISPAASTASVFLDGITFYAEA